MASPVFGMFYPLFLNILSPYWRYYYNNTSAIIYVVDSADHQRISDSQQELAMMLEEEELKGVPLLVFANKQDLPQAMNSGQIFEALGLSQLRDRQSCIFQTSAIQGTGITEGLDWLVNILTSQ